MMITMPLAKDMHLAIPHASGEAQNTIHFSSFNSLCLTYLQCMFCVLYQFVLSVLLWQRYFYTLLVKLLAQLHAGPALWIAHLHELLQDTPSLLIRIWRVCFSDDQCIYNTLVNNNNTHNVGHLFQEEKSLSTSYRIYTALRTWFTLPVSWVSFSDYNTCHQNNL